MAEQMTPPPGIADETPWLHAVLRTIAQRWWLLPLAVLAALLLGSLSLRRAEYSYTAELKVYAAPSTSGSRPASALGGLAALAGIGGGTRESVSPFRWHRRSPSWGRSSPRSLHHRGVDCPASS